MLVPSAESEIDRWLAALEDRVATDPSGVADLFEADAYWRDLLAFTWDLRTFHGHAEICSGLHAARTALVGSQSRRLPDRPVSVAKDDDALVEAFVEIRTPRGRGVGHVRLCLSPDGRPRAQTLLTALDRLAAFPELNGHNRPKGTVHAGIRDRQNWHDRRREALAYASRDPEVLIVGAGQSGLALAARLGQLSVDTLVLEKNPSIGDNWRQRYHSLALHNPIWGNHLPYLPFPSTWPVYVPKDKIGDWLESYASILELNVWTRSTVDQAQFDPTDQVWNVDVVRSDGKVRTLRPAHLVLATGISGVPNLPALPGLDGYCGTRLHSSEFVDGSSFSGKTVLVVGSGNSGHDIAHELYQHGAKVSMLQRSPTTVTSVEPGAANVYARYCEGGMPVDQADTIAEATPIPLLAKTLKGLTNESRLLDADLHRRLERAGFQLDFGEDGTGFYMKFLRSGGGYYLDVGCSSLIAAGDIGLYSGVEIAASDGTKIEFSDGRVASFDSIILATGFKNMQESVRRLLGDEIADRVGPIWGLDAEGELRNMWRRTGQEGLWFMGGALSQVRIYSRYLAIQIKAALSGQFDDEAAMPAGATV